MLRLGLFVLGTCPGGTGSNFWTLLLNGDINLSITMTFVSTVAALGMMPLWIFLMAPLLTEVLPKYVLWKFNHLSSTQMRSFCQASKSNPEWIVIVFHWLQQELLYFPAPAFLCLVTLTVTQDHKYTIIHGVIATEMQLSSTQPNNWVSMQLAQLTEVGTIPVSRRPFWSFNLYQ